MTSSFVTGVVDPLGPEGTVASVLSRSVDPFQARVDGYDSIILSWAPPIPDLWDGIRVVRSRSGFPRTYKDGRTVHLSEEANWNEVPPDRLTDLAGGWHYFSIFLKDGFGDWVRVSTTDALVPYNYDSHTIMWNTIPEYYRVILDRSASPSKTYLRINPALYDGSGGGDAPNLVLGAYLGVFGWGFDLLRTQAEQVMYGYDPSRIHTARLSLLAQQFGHELEASVPAHVNRTVVRNLATLYRRRGTLEGIRDLITAVTGWDVDVAIGPNRLLSEDQTSFVHPEITVWDPTVKYSNGTMVKNGEYVYLNTQMTFGAGQAPPETASSNAYWTYVAYPRTVALTDANGVSDVGTWQIRKSGVAGDGAVYGQTRVGVGVQDPLNPTNYQANALQVYRTTADGGTWIEVVSVPSLSFDPDVPQQKRVLESAVPIPKPIDWVANREYLRGEFVLYNGASYQALRDTTAIPTDTARWAQVSADHRLPFTLSVYAHGPFTGAAGSGGLNTRALAFTYNADGTPIDTFTGTASTSGGVGQAWTRHSISFTPDQDAEYIGVGARVESMPQATVGSEHDASHYFTRWMLHVGTSVIAYSAARELQITVKADAVNFVTNPVPTSLDGYAHPPASTVTLESGWIKQVYDGTSVAALAPPTEEFAVQKGDKAYLSFKYKGPGGLIAIVHHRTAGDVIVRQSTMFLPNVGAEETLIEMPIEVVDDNVDALYLAQLGYLGTTAPAGTHYYREVLWTKGEKRPFFTGASGDDYLWEGAANTSRSFFYEDRLDRGDALRRSIIDSVPLGIGVAEPKFGVYVP